MNAGYQKIWGSEKAAFWFGGGAGVKGFATSGVVGSTTGKSGANYGWWAAFLHNFVIPNASWIAKFVALGELLIGVALILGLFTGVAAMAGLLLNLTYMFTGSAGVNSMYALAAVGLILAWRNAGALGLDRYALRAFSTRFHTGQLVRRVTQRHQPITA
jgi:thiosulfate dehydrogenase [quinone] large subunit